MATANVPAIDLSRPRLRQISHWIRDELDPLVAREGPEWLRADDVLTLHDISQALKTFSSITALDLRATGIHRAVMEISGIATRWPGRLADDCDELIHLWTTKFGRLEDLHPFLYGRGGRLEGIASIEETSKLALLRRWQKGCPDRISPKRARRRGSLGFHPGSWWINTLFACHAGIIDVDTIDGGVCHDKYGAYAVVVIDGAELDAPTESTLTYRCGKDDRGRFRLTAATPRSREPVRILRSHSVNSMWGPKAGVRYEGLYRVRGWAVHQPKTSPFHAGQKVRLGDVYFDIHLERCDPVPVQEVAKSPIASELDDYSEYKRLRKVHKDLRAKAVMDSIDTNRILAVPVKVAPIIPPPAPAPSVRVSSFKVSSAPSRTTTSTSAPGKESPGASQNVSGGSPILGTDGDTYVGQRSASSLSIPAAIPSPVRVETSRSDPPRTHTPSGSRGPGWIGSMSQSRYSIKEVAPWIDDDLPYLTLPLSGYLPLTTCSTIDSQFVLNRPDSRTPIGGKSNRKNDGNSYTVILRPASSIHEPKSGADLGTGERSRPTLQRSRNPVAKLFDSTEDEAGTTVDDYFSLRRPRAASTTSKHPVVASRRLERASSTGYTPQPMALIAVKSVSPSSLLFERRDAIAFPYGYAVSPRSPLDQSLGSLSRDQSPDNDSVRAQKSPRPHDAKNGGEGLGTAVGFRNPFESPRHKHDESRSSSYNVSPQTIV
ncbi:hypothetical protein PMIN06_006731 [Paraphaeosphaeria minitans]